MYGELFKDIEIGAVGFSEEDWCLVQAMEEVGLKHASDGNDKKHVGVWDGDDYIVLSSLDNGSTSRWWQSVKSLWRYGMSPFRIQSKSAGIGIQTLSRQRDFKDITQPNHTYLRSEMEEFDIFILTVPFESNAIEIEPPFRTLQAPFLKQNNTALPPCVTRHVTLFTSPNRLSPTYFKKPLNFTLPKDILTAPRLDSDKHPLLDNIEIAPDLYYTEAPPYHSVGQPPKLGGFGSIASLAISKDDNRDLLDFIFFLENHDVKVTSADEIAKDEPHTTGFQGTSMEAFAATASGTAERHLFEIKVMARGHFFQHPNIVKLFAVFFEDDEVLPGEANIYSPGMIVELADQQNPDLEAYLQSPQRPTPISFETAARIIADTADGLAALHSYGVIHADLKPSNVLLFTKVPGVTRPVAKIADFGFCGIMSSDDTTRGGTDYWNAPEIIARSPQMPHGSYITDPSDFYRDIYSFGLVAAVTALDGNLPFAPEQATRLKLEDGVVDAFANRLEHQSNISRYTTEQLDSFKEIARGSLARDQRSRLTTLMCIRPILFPG
ncbi:hypothetical protein OEA41_006472 [Lepraria neglecta]|uniref:Autophagy-related protein 1 n=1 Tax=Lepraria neglecta TaxID=209136 RepID=A0AAE0DN31_9LECA|nr:hypothetical protein OEA41_006472 [Lepraria neglecta]